MNLDPIEMCGDADAEWKWAATCEPKMNVKFKVPLSRGRNMRAAGVVNLGWRTSKAHHVERFNDPNVCVWKRVGNGLH